MDHLPPLSEGAQKSFPMLCNVQDYDSEEFATFPNRQGWAISEDSFSNISLVKNGPRKQEHIEGREILSLVQAWLFFGTLKEVFIACTTHIDLEDFVFCKPDGEVVIRTDCLPRYINDLSGSKIWRGEASRYVCERILSCFRVGSHFLQQEDVLSRGLGHDRSTSDSLILSIQILGETLEHALKLIWGSSENGGINCISNTERIWSMKAVAPGRTGMQISAGIWCRSEKIMLYGMFDTTTLYYASLLYRPFVGLDHSACGTNHCVARQIDNSVYRTKHVEEECTCKHVMADTTKMSALLQQGRIPCVEVIDTGDDITLSVADSENKNGYIAISHVWSDGLGNARTNSLPQCQLRRLQSYISSLPKNSTPLLWIDTLCVPLNREDRKLALALLGAVYENASIVLVLDSELLQTSAQRSSMEEKLLRICISGWMRRLWTLQEGVLGGARVYFQFNGLAITLPNSFDPLSNTIGLNAMDFIRRYLPSPITHNKSNSHGQLDTSENSSMVDSGGRQSINIMTLLIALQYRLTSRLTDETLCTASLLGESTSTLISPKTAEEKMVHFICLLRNSNVTMPSHILFSGREKIQIEGYRWVLVSFMQMGTVDAQWLLESLQKGGVAQINEKGLVHHFGGLDFELPEPLGDSFDLQMSEDDGRWCRIFPRTLDDRLGSNRGWEEVQNDTQKFGRIGIVLSAEFDILGVLVSVFNRELALPGSGIAIHVRFLCQVYVFWHDESERSEKRIFTGKRIPNDQLWCIG